MIQFPSNRVVPRQGLGPIPQFVVATASEKRMENRLAHEQVVQDLQHLKESRNWHGIEYNGLERTHHFDQTD